MGTLFLLLATLLVNASKATEVITIDKSDGGYENILVAIHSSVKPNDYLVGNIKTLFQSASDFLHRATGGRVYFKKVTIAVPGTWPKRADVMRISSDEFPSSHVRVEVSPNGNDSYTHQTRGCGEPGEYIRLTPEFIIGLNTSTTDTYGNPAYQLIHEWAHFRYGVFDEYAAPGDTTYPTFYCDDGQIRINTCSRDIKFFPATASGDKCKLYDDCKVSDDCIPYLDPSQALSAQSSIMFMPPMENIGHFCEAKGPRRHNPTAPNKQNAICKGKSAWEVISSNDDFVLLAPPDLLKSTTVTFREIQQAPQCSGRYVLVLDVSGSMAGDSMKILKQATTAVLTNLFPDDIDVGIVSFSTQATIRKSITKLDSGSRQDFAEVIQDLWAEGGTAIGTGLITGLTALKAGVDTAEGGTIILMTDGEENTGPTMHDVLPKLIQEKVKVSALAFGNDADAKLEEIIQATGGQMYSLLDDVKHKQNHGDINLEIDSAMFTSAVGGFEGCALRMTVAEVSVNVTTKETLAFTIDSDLGDDTVVTILSSSPQSLNITLLNPRGEVFTSGAREVTDTAVVIKIPSPATMGTWKVLAGNLGGGMIDFNMRISSKTKDPADEPIRAIAYVNRASVETPEDARIYAEVTKGKYVVICARVVATVKRPGGGRAVDVELQDNGVGADVTAYDGVYSAYFTEFSGKGRYAVVIRVYDNGSAELANGRFSSRGIPLYPRPKGNIVGSMKEAFTTTAFESVTKMSPHTATVQHIVKRSEQFQRVANAGSFQTKADFQQKEIPPGTITDLKASVLKRTRGKPLNTTLSWTCPGAHMDSGRASHIDIRYSLDLNNLLRDFQSAEAITERDILTGGLSLLPPGGMQKVTLTLPVKAVGALAKSKNSPLYFAARVWNHENIASEISNVATASRPPRCCVVIIFGFCVPCPLKK
ncbi:calcium-activated chloride channel regulator 1-like [Ornithodoros turicata]|uniref:calcium-activated chloride channel regulator 1-like n=1 Tax=Ornithodoros turicata TaxID=34597 RepID=UPI00313A2B61